LIVFRVIYYWAPLALAAVLLVGYEVILRKHPPAAERLPERGGGASP
jgi:uncharacterized membrane protein YbhN (UPF0104 family)